MTIQEQLRQRFAELSPALQQVARYLLEHPAEVVTTSMRHIGVQAGSTPATLTACQKTTPANPLPAPTVACAAAQAVGGTGALGWHFTGVLSPAGSGTVLFTVRVD